MASERFVITVDGPSGAGKSTVSRLLAQRLGYTYLDTGAMYRAFALAVSRGGKEFDSSAVESVIKGFRVRLEEKNGETRTFLGDEDVSDRIRSPRITELASRVSAVAAVRGMMVGLQREMGARGGVVAEGRDMGTVVFPRARVKFFLSADPRERARRRHAELVRAGRSVTPEQVARDLALRDERDTGRDIAPLRPAEDAVYIDSTGRSVEEVVEYMAAVVRRVGEEQDTR